jgi:hypothetical protein
VQYAEPGGEESHPKERARERERERERSSYSRTQRNAQPTQARALMHPPSVLFRRRRRSGRARRVPPSRAGRGHRVATLALREEKGVLRRARHARHGSLACLPHQLLRLVLASRVPHTPSRTRTEQSRHRALRVLLGPGSSAPARDAGGHETTSSLGRKSGKRDSKVSGPFAAGGACPTQLWTRPMKQVSWVLVPWSSLTPTKAHFVTHNAYSTGKEKMDH